MISWTNILKGAGRGFAASAKSSGAASVVVWNLTRQCNMSCRHCYADASPEPVAGELRRPEAKELMADLARSGVKVVLFSGGEPLMRPDIFELAQEAQQAGVRVALSTNGTLITPRIASQIRNAGFSYVGVSLDGAPATHDAFRRRNGAFDAAVAGLRACREVGLKTGCRLTLFKHNKDDLSAVFDIAEREHLDRLCIYHLVASGRAREIFDDDLTHEERRRALEFIFQKTAEFGRAGFPTEILTVDNHADAGWLYLKLRKTDEELAEKAWETLLAQGGNASGTVLGCVDADGSVYADQFLRTHVLGNVRRQPFGVIWQDENNAFLAALRNRAARLKGRCPRCSFLPLCNGNFRARAEGLTGDLWAEDPSCYLTDEETSDATAHHLLGNHAEL